MSISVYLHERSLKGNKVAFQLRIYKTGEPQRYETVAKCEDKRDLEDYRAKKQLAKTIKSKMELQYTSGQYFVPNPVDTDFISYFEQQTQKNKLVTWSITLNHLRKYAKKISLKSLNAAKLEDIKEYFLTLRTAQGDTVTTNTAHNYFKCVKACLNKAEREGLLSMNPVRKIENIKTTEVEKVFLSIDELQALKATTFPTRNTYADEIRRSFFFACLTGLRISDLSNLRWKDISNRAVNITQQKTKSTNSVPLSEQALPYLGEQGEANEFVFHLPPPQHGNEYLHQWGKAAGLAKHITWHTARHTFGTLTYAYSGDIYLTSKLLGHKKIATTQIYAKVLDERRREAVEKLPVF